MFEGENVVVKATVAGTPLPKVTWERGGRTLRARDGVLCHDSGASQTMIIEHVTQDYTGTDYTCRYLCFSSQKSFHLLSTF